MDNAILIEEKVTIEPKIRKISLIFAAAVALIFFTVTLIGELSDGYGHYNTDYLFVSIGIFVGVFAVFGLIVPFAFKGMGITVYEKRITGQGLFGRKIDLPIDSVSSVSISWFSLGLTVASASGRATFLFFSKRQEIYKVISDLITNRRTNTVITSSPAAAASEPALAAQEVDETDKILKYKNLLDQGIITQEEFDQKKKEILGL